MIKGYLDELNNAIEDVSDIWAFNDDTLVVATMYSGMYVTVQAVVVGETRGPADTRVRQLCFDDSGMALALVRSDTTPPSSARSSSIRMVRLCRSFNIRIRFLRVYDLVASANPDTSYTFNGCWTVCSSAMNLASTG